MGPAKISICGPGHRGRARRYFFKIPIAYQNDAKISLPDTPGMVHPVQGLCVAMPGPKFCRAFDVFVTGKILYRSNRKNLKKPRRG